MSKKVDDAKLKIHGSVTGFNVSPKGHIEGVIVETLNGDVQVNFPKESARALAASMTAGAVIYLHVEQDEEAKDRPLYWACEDDVEIRGRIARLNHAHHGAVNGFHLEDATFLHLKHHDAERHDFHVGDSVRATGTRRAGPDVVVLDVHEIERIQRMGKAHDLD